ncbi:unnamed protein product [Heterosigma akashiwo]
MVSSLHLKTERWMRTNQDCGKRKELVLETLDAFLQPKVLQVVQEKLLELLSLKLLTVV